MGFIGRSRTGACAQAAACGALILLVAGCGASTKNTSESRHAVDAAFATRAAAACQQGNRLNSGGSPPPYPKFNPQHPTVSEMPAMGRWIQSGVLPAREALRLAERLGQPGSGATAWNQFLTAADGWLQELHTQATAAKRAQVSAFITSTRALQGDLDLYRGAAVKAGVRQCGGIFGPQGPPPTPPAP